MTVDEFVASNPSKEDVARELCKVANNYVLWINDTYLWVDLADKYDLKVEEFYTDDDETRANWGDEAVDKVGIVNWKYKGRYGLWG